MARPKKYEINLTEEEVTELKRIIRRKTTSKMIISRCQILLDLDESHGRVLYYTLLQNTQICDII